MTARATFSVDEEAERLVYAPMSRIREEFLPSPRGKVVIDVGGGNGNFGLPYAQAGARVLTIDLDRAMLRQVPQPGEAARTSLLQLPVRDGAADAVIGRAILHHVPDALPAAAKEMARVLRPGGGLLIQEPCAGNLPADLARRWFPTDRHEPGERVLPLDAYVAALRERFTLDRVVPHFVTSYLAPHAVARAPGPATRRAAGFAARLDDRLLANLPRLRGRAAYVSLVGTRK